MKDLQALNLVAPTRENLVLDPLAVKHLDNRLFVIATLNRGHSTVVNKNKIEFSDQLAFGRHGQTF